MEVVDKIKSLTNQLYPTGRTFWKKLASDFDKLTDGLNASEVRAYNDAVSTLDSAIPDNDNFSTDDATAWEVRLGLITNPAVSLSDRKLAIIRKMNHPGTIPARQNYRYLQGQLQAAGFNVFVYENRFQTSVGYITKTPTQFSLTTYPVVPLQYGLLQYGDFQYGNSYGNKVANSINQTEDDSFDLGTNLKSTFFIGGSPAGSYADVQLSRKVEFRQLILKIKPVQTVAFLLINYI